MDCPRAQGLLGGDCDFGTTKLFHQTIEACTETVPNVVIVSDVTGIPALWTRVEEYGGVPGMHFESSLLLSTRQAFKRFADLLIVAIGSPIVVPLMLLTAIAIKLASPKGPIFFGQSQGWQEREVHRDLEIPHDGPERISDSSKSTWRPIRNAARSTRPSENFLTILRVIPHVGAFLRKFSLDELPQLWNVIRGEMSLVGPRPMMHEEISRYADTFKLYKKMRPGITGLWQVSGRNRTTFQERVDLDAYYVTNWSPWFDLYILFRTIRTVLLGEGAY